MGRTVSGIKVAAVSSPLRLNDENSRRKVQNVRADSCERGQGQLKFGATAYEVIFLTRTPCMRRSPSIGKVTTDLAKMTLESGGILTNLRAYDF
jgi:hypothetical protein